MSYDAWKTRSPDDEYPEEECFHEDYEANSEGRAICCRCGETWWMTAADYKREHELSVAHDRYCRREERRARIERLLRKFRFWRRWRKPELIEDDLPF